MPYMHFNKFTLEVFEIEKPILINYKVSNFGNDSAKIMKSRMGYLICKPFNKIDPIVVYRFLQNDFKSSYYIKFKSLNTLTFNSSKVLQRESFNSFMSSNSVLYFFGEIEYQNARDSKNKKMRMSKFCMQIASISLRNSEVLYNITLDTN